MIRGLTNVADSKAESGSVVPFAGVHQNVRPRGPYNKGYDILGSILGCPCLGKLPFPKITDGRNEMHQRGYRPV